MIRHSALLQRFEVLGGHQTPHGVTILCDVHPAVAVVELGQDIGEGPLVTGDDGHDPKYGPLPGRCTSPGELELELLDAS
jgi:hypothetical protein